MQYTTTYMSPLGRITMAGDGDALTGLWFEGQTHFASTFGSDCAEEDDSLPLFRQTCDWLDCYFSRKNPSFMPPVKTFGTVFQETVWHILRQIPYGTVVTYAGIARLVAKQRGMKSMSPQAVGGAVGRNPVSIVIPCHRVIGTDGSLTGYAGGIERKKALLMMEGGMNV